jgi:hypothetical protein
MKWLWSCPVEAPVSVTWSLTKMARRRFFEENRDEPHHSWSTRTWPITMVETPRVGDVPCEKDSLRCPL